MLIFCVDDVIMVAPPLPASWDNVDVSVDFPATGHSGLDTAGGTSDFCGMEIHRCALEARTFIALLLDTQVTLQKKVKVYPARLEALGWVFDLRYDQWFVAPKEEKLLKLFYFLFVAIPPTATTAVSKDIEILAGLLN